MPGAGRKTQKAPKDTTHTRGRSGHGASPAQLIDERIEELGDWRGKMLSRLRALIKQADRAVVEEWKWNVPVWSHDGLICTGETYRHVSSTRVSKAAPGGRSISARARRSMLKV